MNTQELIAEAQSRGARFELEGDGFKVLAPLGAVTRGAREELTTRKAEVIALLKQPDTEIEVSFTAGNCPHCRRPIEVTASAVGVSLRCPEGRLFKQLKPTVNEWCSDCGIKLSVLVGRCVECVRRVMTAPDDPCPVCNGLRFWRYRAGREKPAGFGWHCSNCHEPVGKVAVYEVSQ